MNFTELNYDDRGIKSIDKFEGTYDQVKKDYTTKINSDKSITHSVLFNDETGVPSFTYTPKTGLIAIQVYCSLKKPA